MNFDHDFFQVSKLSEDQKMEHFSPNSGEDQKKEGLHQKWNTFYPQIQVETCAQIHTRVKLLEGMQSNYWGDISPPSPPGFGTPAQTSISPANYTVCNKI